MPSRPGADKMCRRQNAELRAPIPARTLPHPIREEGRFGSMTAQHRSTARDIALGLARGRRPAGKDRRRDLQSRFGLDGDRTPTELDGVEYRDPEATDTPEMAHALAVLHVPLWLISPDEARLLFVHGFDSPSVFRLALLMLEEEPFLETQGQSYGALLPAAGGTLAWDYDPVADRAQSGGDEDRFRGGSLGDIVQRLRPRSERELEIVSETAVAMAPPRRFAETSGRLNVRQVGNRVVVLSRHDSRGADAQDTPDVRIFLVGRRDTNRLWAIAVHDGRPFARFGNYFEIGLEGAVLGMQEDYGIPTASWRGFDDEA